MSAFTTADAERLTIADMIRLERVAATTFTILVMEVTGGSAPPRRRSKRRTECPLCLMPFDDGWTMCSDPDCEINSPSSWG